MKGLNAFIIAVMDSKLDRIPILHKSLHDCSISDFSISDATEKRSRSSENCIVIARLASFAIGQN